MPDIPIQKLFTHSFLGVFILSPSLLPFSNNEIIDLDKRLHQYEQLFLNPDIEKNLISKNELLASFAISKAENSTLTLSEAEDVYALIQENEDFTFISEKLQKNQKLTQKDYDKLEFFNIAKTFKTINQNPITIADITPEFIQNLHKQLTQGLDIFEKYLHDFTVYKSGHWRDSNMIRVGSYIPSPFHIIPQGVEELLSWIKDHQDITSVGIFHTALYALHPFNNGNKRVSRVLEHIFLRSLGINKTNLYSTSYYYHTEKDRYYKYLLFSLERKNLTHFVSFFQEALTLSIISVIKTSLEVKRSEFITGLDTNTQTKSILRPLIKRHELQFKTLFKMMKIKMARQTFVTYLQKATEERIVTKRTSGRATYYSLNISPQEEQVLHGLVDFAKTKLSFIPAEIKLA